MITTLFKKDSSFLSNMFCSLMMQSPEEGHEERVRELDLFSLEKTPERSRCVLPVFEGNLQV